ncbi:unnamed protein product [Adineta ricciae]|uniref:Death domain-containing protein n=1 Tax=Adineta ricciae TaxID=249248 RepID=A0A815TIX9_ADIRI|nr:unnamed protein product [Adineta ricciae]
MVSISILDRSLVDLRREITDLRQIDRVEDYDTKRLSSIINLSRESLKETEKFQEQILNQLQQFEISLADINDILRANVQRKIQLEQQQKQQSGDDLEIRAKLMALNAETLECRAAAIQLQQEARRVLSRAAEIDKLANDELAQQALERKMKQQEIERNRAAELERRVKLEEERKRLKELQQQQESILAMVNKPIVENEYVNWSIREFMHADENPPCIIRTSPENCSIPIDVTYVPVSETEYLLDKQEELISTPLRVKFNSIVSNQPFIVVAIPYIIKRSPHRENVIKIRQSNGLWISIDTNESLFDSHKVRKGKLIKPVACAVVSRLKRDRVLIRTHSSGRYSSSADARFTFEWPKHVSENNIHLQTCIQPVDIPAFAQFCEQYKHECRGLLAVGPIIELTSVDASLIKPIQFTLPILVQPKKKTVQPKVAESAATDSGTISHELQQEFIIQQQQLIFKSMLGEDLGNERLVLLYSNLNSNENLWTIDTDLHVVAGKVPDVVTVDMQSLHTRMIVARYDKQVMSAKQLQTVVYLFEQTLNQRTATLMLRHRSSNPNEICLVCCSSQRRGMVTDEIQQENYSNRDEQIKEITLQEGQLLELRFRGNVLPTNHVQQTIPFAFNTNFPFYFETNVSERDKYSQHLSTYFYGHIQIYSKQKTSRSSMKEIEKKKQQLSVDMIKQDWPETDTCLSEILLSLPKPPEKLRTPIEKTLSTFSGEGILTSALFRDISMSLADGEWRQLANCLGMTRMRIEAIERDYRYDAPYYMLLTWFKRVSRSSDKVSALTHALVNIKRWDLAQELQTIKNTKRLDQSALSKDEQLKMCRASFNRICQREECVRIWKQLARELALTNDDIIQIERSYPSKHERCLRCLEQWASNQTRIDILFLAKVIRMLGFKPLAREIESMA